jgi:hypothetical protein
LLRRGIDEIAAIKSDFYGGRETVGIGIEEQGAPLEHSRFELMEFLAPFPFFLGEPSWISLFRRCPRQIFWFIICERDRGITQHIAELGSK